MIDSNVYFQNLAEERVGFDILKRAADLKVGKFICSSLSAEDWSLLLSLVRTEERIVPFFGIHPWYAEADPAGWDSELAHILINHAGAGIGTIGLDKSPNGGDYVKQKKIFLRQLQLAEQMSRPVAIHCDQAWDDLMGFIQDHKPARTRFMIRDYQGSAAILEQLTALGAYISFSREALKEKSALTLELARKVRKDRMLLETNFPCAAAKKVETEVSAEIYFGVLHETYALAAQATGVALSEIERMVWDNGQRFLYGAPS